MIKRVALLVFFFVVPLTAQERPSGAENPLLQLKEQVKSVLAAAQLPFSDDQEKAITLMMEDRRKASEDLFGDLMDFRAGPTRGQEADRLNSAIEWLRNEFLNRLQDYLRPEQLAAWSKFRETESASAGGAGRPEPGVRRRPTEQVQYVRINNNPVTAEESDIRIGGGGGNFNGGGNRNATEVIQRGGTGAFHGNFQLLWKDSRFNAGRRFAKNKPPYQETQTSFDVSGPLVPGRLTTQFGGNLNSAQNADTITAILPTGPFTRNVTKPTTFRQLTTGNTLQLSDIHAISANFGYRTNTRKNQGIGGFTLEERAFGSTSTNWNLELKEFSAISARTIFESRLNISDNHDVSTPVTNAPKITVVDLFSGGGAQNQSDVRDRNYDFSNLYTRLGEKLTWKIGSAGTYRRRQSVSETNFGGAFTFKTLDGYVSGIASQYRVTLGDPALEVNQLEFAGFVQNDFKLSSRFTLMSGVRYEVQTNMKDHNNFQPRLGFAYAVGRATVIRGGGGFFQEFLPINVFEYYTRLDGKRQYELVIDNPSYPDPYQAGSLRPPSSVRVFDPHLVNPFSTHVMGSWERTFLANLFVSAEYDYNRLLHRFKNRNLNATYDATDTVVHACRTGQTDTCIRPDPTRGNVINLETVGVQLQHTLRLNFRQRFSIFNVTANYQFQLGHADSVASGQLGGGGGGNGGAAAGGGGSDNFGFGPEILPTDNYNLRADFSRVNMPVHSVNSTVNARLPLGLFLTETMHYDVGRRYTITTGNDENLDGNFNDRPSGATRNGGEPVANMSFDFNISKAVFFGNPNGSRKNANVFANITNVFNRANYNPRSGVMTSSNFGRSTSAQDPREIEVGLRFQF